MILKLGKERTPAGKKQPTNDASHGERSDGEYSAKGVDFVRQRCDGGLSLRSP